MVYTTRMSGAEYVTYGYGQVEPNHLSAQRTGQIYAQLPALKTIDKLENGQFVKYNYAENVVDFEGEGEWMLVLNEIKLYHENEADSDFAMIRNNYLHQVYSPYGTPEEIYQSRFYGPNGVKWDESAKDYVETETDAEGYITAPARTGVLGSTNNPFANMLGAYKAKNMKELNENVDARSLVPRVLKTNVGDIFTTNTINEAELELGDKLAIGANGYLVKEANKAENAGAMLWQVVKVYTMPDNQKGVKIMRIA